MKKIISGFENLMIAITFAEVGEFMIQQDELSRHKLHYDKGGLS